MPEIDLSKLSINLNTKSDYDGETLIVVELLYDGEVISESQVGLGIGNEG